MSSQSENPSLIIGSNIQRLRKSHGFTQEVFAEYLGINREEVSYYENGSRNIPSNIITKAAKLFAIAEYDLYEEDPAIASLNIAFAFRAESLQAGDLDSIAQFKTIAMNYLKLRKALGSINNPSPEDE